MQNIHLGFVDYLILAIYFTFVLGIGWALKRYMKTSKDFFLSGRSLPAWITGLAFISANLGAQEVIGMGLDIRLPIGLMFTILGLLLAGYGLVGDKEIYARSL